MVDLGALSAFPVGQWKLHSLEVPQEGDWKTRQARATRVRHAVWVRRGAGEQDVTVLSSLCPHLGCLVNWRPAGAQFFCPCHGGVFDADGRNVAGPPPRPLDALECAVRAGHLWVRWQSFKSGVAERVPVRS
jgi:Rieske Fe-S protein